MQQVVYNMLYTRHAAKSRIRQIEQNAEKARSLSIYIQLNYYLKHGYCAGDLTSPLLVLYRSDTLILLLSLQEASEARQVSSTQIPTRNGNTLQENISLFVYNICIILYTRTNSIQLLCKLYCLFFLWNNYPFIFILLRTHCEDKERIYAGVRNSIQLPKNTAEGENCRSHGYSQNKNTFCVYC